MKILRKHIVYILIVLFCNKIIAQYDYNIDSLILIATKTAADTNKLIVLSIISENATDNVWPIYNNEMGKLAAKLQNSSNPAIKLCAKRHLAASLNNKGFFFTERGISYKAILYFNKSLAIQREIRDLEGQAYSLSNLGAIYDSKGEIDKALEYYFSAVKIRENLGSKKSLAQSYNNIAVLYDNQNDLINAIKYHYQSLKIRKLINEPSGVALAYNNIGTTYTHLVESSFKGGKSIPDSLLDIPLDYFKKSYAAYKEDDNNLGMAHSMFNLGDLYILRADCFFKKNDSEYDTLLNKAEILFSKCLIICKAGDQKEWIANTFNGFANVYWRQGKLVKAKESALKAMSLAQELGYPSTIQKSADILRKIYRNTNDFKNSLLMSDLFYSMRDSVINDKNKKETLSKYFLYQSEKQHLLNKSNQEKMQLEFSAKTKQQSIIIYFGISGLFVLAVFAAFMFNRFKLTQKQNQIIQHQKNEVEENRREIVDSINYAKKIQYALLANESILYKNLGEYFVLFNPKDIVSGDFYWATEHDDKFYIAVCDSTGHGVPGAFMSLLNIGFLSEAIKEKNLSAPNDVLNYVRKRLIESISYDGQQDGMDAILLCFDRSKNIITYSAANNEPIIIREGAVIELPKDKMPVGKGERMTSFTLHTIDYKKDDVLYLYTDGYADQFGGPKGKKFKYKQLNDLLLTNAELSMIEQKELLQNTLTSWKGSLEQVDDICIVGIKL